MKNRKARRIITVIAALVVVAGFVSGIFVFGSGVLKSDPVVEAKPDNCYEETLHVITDEDYRPYSFYDGNGNMSGHDVELITLIANELNMNLDLRFMPWNDAIKAADEGKADVLMTCDYSDSFEGVDVLLKSEPLSTDEFIVYSKGNISSVNALYDRKCAIMENGNVMPMIDMLELKKNCVTYKDNRQAMTALENGEVDCAIMRYTVGEALLGDLGYTDINSDVSIGQSYMCFGIAGNNTEIEKKINGAVETLKINGKLDELRSKWLTTFIHTPSFRELVSDNMALILGAFALIVIFLVFFILNERRRLQANAEKNQYMNIVENLANDFECVNYIELRENLMEDKAVLVRTSEALKRNIPGWDTETVLSRRMELFEEAVIAPEDREDFIRKTANEHVLEKLGSDGAYFVNFKANIDGVPRYFQMKFSLVKDEDGRNTAVVLGIHNVDEETKREIAVQEALESALEKEKETEERLEMANKSKTDFLFNMSHDIRTPMNAVIGFTGLAKKHIDDREKVEDYLDKIDGSSKHLLTLINEVLDMSRVEAGKLSSDMKAVNVKKAAEKMVTLYKETADLRNIRLSLITDDVTHENVIADELHVDRIITNILGNSIKYTMPGGTIIYTVRELESDNPDYGKYEFTIEDNGIGMSKEFVDRIFESFSREENETVHEIQGTGLGMTIVKRLVDFLDGTVNIESERGKGTKVTIVLHFRLTDSVASDDAAAVTAGSFAGRKVLLVEDNDLNREIAGEILAEQGIVVEEAVNGKEAVSAIKQKGPDYYDFVLMDIQMPFMNGYEATKEIRKLYPDAKLPIIALSANAFEEDKAVSREAGMNDHIAKPIVIKDLFACLARFLN